MTFVVLPIWLIDKQTCVTNLKGIMLVNNVILN